jgi:hypothetical protein
MIIASGIRYIRRANKKRQEKMDAEQAQSGHSYSNQGSAQYGRGQHGSIQAIILEPALCPVWLGSVSGTSTQPWEPLSDAADAKQ